jgi:hypothetical protein
VCASTNILESADESIVVTYFVRAVHVCLVYRRGPGDTQASVLVSSDTDYLLPPHVLERAKTIVFRVPFLSGDGIGCGYFIAPKLAITVYHAVESRSDIEGRSLGTPSVTLCFRVVYFHEGLDFALLEYIGDAHDYFQVAELTSCDRLLGLKSAVLLEPVSVCRPRSTKSTSVSP